MFPYARRCWEGPYEIAEWVLSGRRMPKEVLIMAVVTAASRSLNLHDVDDSTAFWHKILPQTRLE